jgi:hypothetical protein
MENEEPDTTLQLDDISVTRSTGSRLEMAQQVVEQMLMAINK